VRIAEPVIGTGWQDVILRAKAADDIVRGLAQQGIIVSEADIRILAAKLGNTGLIDAIRARVK
jgi:hypothetical protein